MAMLLLAGLLATAAIAEPAAPVAPTAIPAAAAPVAPVVTPVAVEKPKLICRRDVEIGSMVKSTKQCHTEKEWREIRATAQSELLRQTTERPLNQ